jgi:hypothetical protein
MSTPQHSEALFEEDRLELARQDYQLGRYQTPHAAATAFDIKPKKLKRRLNGIGPRLGSIAKNRLLTPTEEESLV